MKTGTNGETPPTSELDLSIILQGILWLSLSWMVSTFIHVLCLLLLWGSEDAVLDELMKRLFCFASRWRCVWMCLRLNEWEGQCDEMKEQPRSPIADVDLFIPVSSYVFCWARLIVLPVLLLFPWYSWRLTPCLLSSFLHYCPWLLSMSSWYCLSLSVIRSLLSIHPTLLIACSIRIAIPVWYVLRYERMPCSSFLNASRRMFLAVTAVIFVQGPWLRMAVVSIFQRCRDCASLHLQLDALLFMGCTHEAHPASEAMLAVLCGRSVSIYPVSISWVAEGMDGVRCMVKWRGVLWWCGRLAELGSVL